MTKSNRCIYIEAADSNKHLLERSEAVMLTMLLKATMDDSGGIVSPKKLNAALKRRFPKSDDFLLMDTAMSLEKKGMIHYTIGVNRGYKLKITNDEN